MAQTATFPAPVQLSLRVLTGISVCHLLNDLVQSLLPSIYPILKSSFHLTFGEIGFVTLAYQLTASLLQPFVGQYTDKRPLPYSLPFAMAFTLVGLILMGLAFNLSSLLLAAVLIGLGSAIFHPEASKVANLAAGRQRGLAQSIFQVGGNAGSSIGPLLAALIIAHRGQQTIVWFTILPALALILLINVGNWYKSRAAAAPKKHTSKSNHVNYVRLSKKRIGISVLILLVLIFSKYFYLASMTSYYTFYLMSKFHLSVKDAQLHLFIFLFSVAAGTLAGGPIGDRFGRKYVIWFSILGVAPFTLLLPYMNLFWTSVLTVFIGIILASAFSAILVYAQELLPGNLGLVSGLFFGFAFGMGGLGSAVLGMIADKTSIYYVYQLCSFLPLIGILTAFLPDIGERKKKEAEIISN